MSPQVSLGCWHTPQRGHSRSCGTSPVREPWVRWTEPRGGQRAQVLKQYLGMMCQGLLLCRSPGPDHVPSPGAGGCLGLENGQVKDGGEDPSPSIPAGAQQLPQPALGMLK